MTQSSELRKGFPSYHDLTSFLKTLVELVWPGFELTTSRSADRRSSNWANRAGIPRVHPQGNPDYLYKAAVCNQFPSVVPCWVGDGGGGGVDRWFRDFRWSLPSRDFLIVVKFFFTSFFTEMPFLKSGTTVRQSLNKMRKKIAITTKCFSSLLASFLEVASNLWWVGLYSLFLLEGDGSHDLPVVQNLDFCLIGIPPRYIYRILI